MVPRGKRAQIHHRHTNTGTSFHVCPLQLLLSGPDPNAASRRDKRPSKMAAILQDLSLLPPLLGPPHPLHGCHVPATAGGMRRVAAKALAVPGRRWRWRRGPEPASCPLWVLIRCHAAQPSVRRRASVPSESTSAIRLASCQA